MKINVLFFGVISDKTGLSSKIYENFKNINELKLQIESDYPTIKKFSYQISVNKELCDNNIILKNNDEVALLPPFAGG